MNDLISRQAAINAADRADYRGLTVEDVKKVTDEVVKELKQIPAADVEEVIRCEKCMHAKKRNYAPAKCQWYCSLSTNYHSGNFFCASGEPRMDLLEWIHRGDDDEQIQNVT